MKYKKFYLIFSFSLIHLNIVNAFFQVNNHTDEIWIDHTTTQTSTQGNNVFQLHDNFSSNNTDGFFIKGSDDFIAADKIEIKIPLKILARDSVYPENSIDRMLLANLRTKKLIVEYTQLQQKARTLFQSHSTVGKNRSSGQSINNQGTPSGADFERNKEAINRQLFNINRLSKLTQDDVPSNDSILVDEYSFLDSKTDPGAKTNPYLADAAPSIGEPQDRVTTNEGRQVLNRQENTELPWIFTFFLNLLNYGLNNRVEIILYAIFIAAIGFFISLQVRR